MSSIRTLANRLARIEADTQLGAGGEVARQLEEWMRGRSTGELVRLLACCDEDMRHDVDEATANLGAEAFALATRCVEKATPHD